MESPSLQNGSGRGKRYKEEESDEGLTPTKDEGTCLRRLSMFRKEVH